MKPRSNYKLFYIHTPKTAGSSVNEYFTNIFPNSICHIEGKLKSEKGLDLDKYDFASGHIGYTHAHKILDDKWLKLVTFREPYSFVISHLCWIRLLADPGQEERFNNHPEIFQRIATKMASLDLSKAGNITLFIEWLDSISCDYLHNTQTFYLDYAKTIEGAKAALKNIEFVGTLEKIDKFLELINYELSLDVKFERAPRKNVNKQKYGLDINNPEHRQALLPLIDKDIEIYEIVSDIQDNNLNSYELPSKEAGEIRGWIDHVSEGSVRGWGMYINSSAHLSLGLYLNDKLIQETVANIARVGLKKRKIHRTGFCAFNFNINDIYLCKEDKLIVRDLHTGLNISPTKDVVSAMSIIGVDVN